MKRRQLLDHLKKHGCELDKPGGNHDKYVNYASGKKTAVPRHNEIDNDLAKEICKQLDVPIIR